MTAAGAPPDPSRFRKWLRQLPPDASASAARLIQLAADAIAWAEENFERAGAERLAAGVDCCRGCAHCCWLPVETTVAEVLHAWSHARRQLSEGAFARLAARAAAPAPDRPAPCPFLEADQCGVYAARRLACRAWNSTDVRACRSAREPPSATHPAIPMNARLKAVYANVGEALARGLVQRGLEPVDLRDALQVVTTSMPLWPRSMKTGIIFPN